MRVLWDMRRMGLTVLLGCLGGICSADPMNEMINHSEMDLSTAIQMNEPFGIPQEQLASEIDRGLQGDFRSLDKLGWHYMMYIGDGKFGNQWFALGALLGSEKARKHLPALHINLNEVFILDDAQLKKYRDAAALGNNAKRLFLYTHYRMTGNHAGADDLLQALSECDPHLLRAIDLFARGEMLPTVPAPPWPGYTFEPFDAPIDNAPIAMNYLDEVEKSALSGSSNCLWLLILHYMGYALEAEPGKRFLAWGILVEEPSVLKMLRQGFNPSEEELWACFILSPEEVADYASGGAADHFFLYLHYKLTGAEEEAREVWRYFPEKSIAVTTPLVGLLEKYAAGGKDGR